MSNLIRDEAFEVRLRDILDSDFDKLTSVLFVSCKHFRQEANVTLKMAQIILSSVNVKLKSTSES